MVLLFVVLTLSLLIPGYTVTRLLRTPMSSVMLIPYAFFTGYALWALLVPVAFLAHLSWTVLLGVYLTLAGVFCVLFLFKQYYRIDIRIPAVDSVAWAGMILMVAVMGWKGGYQDGDAWYHLAQANYYMHSDTLHSGNAYYKGLPAGTVYDYNSYHLFLAALSRMTGLDLAFIWVHLLPIFILLYGLTFYGIIREFFASRLTPVLYLAIVLLALITSDEGLTQWSTIVYPGGFSLLTLIPLIIYTLVKRTEEIPLKGTLHLALLVFTLSSLHLFNYVYLIIQLSLIFLVLGMQSFRAADRMQRWKTHAATLAVCVGSGLLYLIAAYFTTRSAQPPESFPGTPLRLVQYSDTLYAFPPDQLYPLTMLTLVLTGIVWFTRPRLFNDRRTVFFVVPILFQPFLLYNPVLVPLFAKALHINLVGRFKTIIWTLMLLPLLVEHLIRRMTLYRFPNWFPPPRRILIPVGAMLFVAITAGIAYSHLDDLLTLGNRILAYDRLRGPFFQIDFYRRIDTIVPPRSIILSDPYTSYHIPTFADQFIHAANVHSIQNLNIQERYQDYLRIISPYSSLYTKHRYSARNNIDYLVVNEAITPLTYLEDPITRSAPLLTGRLYPAWDVGEGNGRLYTLGDAPASPDTGLQSVYMPISFVDSLQTDGATVFLYPAASKTAESLHFTHAGYIILKIEILKLPLPRKLTMTLSSSYGFHQVLQIGSYARTDEGWSEDRIQTEINRIKAGDRYVYTLPIPGKTIGVFISGSAFLDLRLEDIRLQDAL